MSHPRRSAVLAWGATSTGTATLLARLNPPGFAGAALEIALGQPAPCTGSLRHLRVHVLTGPVSGSQDFRIYRNGIATDVVAQLGAGETDASDVTHTADVNAGDIIEARAETSGAVTGALYVSATCLLLGP